MESLRFLIIGSERRFFNKIKNVLNDMGFYYDYVKNLNKGLKKALSSDYDILLFDLSAMAKDYDSIDYLKQIVKIVQADTIDYILAVTDEKNRAKFIKLVGDNRFTFLDSPLDIKEFKHVIDNITEVINLKKDIVKKEKKLLPVEVIIEIARKALSYQDEDALLWEIAGLTQKKLNIYHINMFIIDEKGGNIVLKAFSGSFGKDLIAGYSFRLGDGICGWVAANRQSLVSGDVKNEPRRIKGFDFEENVNSEMAVPIIYENKVYGVLHAESLEKNAFSSSDLMVFETVADQMSLVLENLRLTRELIESKKLSETINDSLPVSTIILDQDFKIKYANLTFCEINNLKREEILGKPFQDFLSKEFLEEFDLSNEFKRVIDSGISITHSNIKHSSRYHNDKVLNVTFTHVEAGKYPKIMVLIQDVTDFSKKTYQLLLLREISLAMQGVFERDKLLHLILTYVTAGFAIGLNRAFLFLVNDNREKLYGILGVGPSSYEEAYRTWDELSRQAFTFQNYLENINKGVISKSTLQNLVENKTFDIKTSDNVITDTVNNAKYYHVLNAWENPRVNEEMKELLASKEFVTIPLITKNEVIGVLMADNAYSGKNINMDSIEVLTMLGGSAAIAIENAKIHIALEEKINELQNANIELNKTQEMLIRKEKLAAIGEVSAHLAHEVRNPLATIGGFAKSIPKKYNDKERTIRNANIIVEEVTRLEHILSDVLDFSKPSIPFKSPTDINELVINTLRMLEGTVFSNGVIVVTNFGEGKLIAEFDSAQIKQVLINVIQNALYAMPKGGTLEIATYVGEDKLCIDIRDTGRGISAKNLESVFEPFFSTNSQGTGLGLAISQMIIQNHNGNITIKSAENMGTTVNILLPLK